jgi:hypothetical protein
MTEQESGKFRVTRAAAGVTVRNTPTSRNAAIASSDFPPDSKQVGARRLRGFTALAPTDRLHRCRSHLEAA